MHELSFFSKKETKIITREKPVTKERKKKEEKRC
jgi:hypothetical protein